MFWSDNLFDIKEFTAIYVNVLQYDRKTPYTQTFHSHQKGGGFAQICNPPFFLDSYVYLFVLIKASKLLYFFLRSTFVNICPNWLIWQILSVKKKDDSFWHISGWKYWKTKQCPIFGHRTLIPCHVPFFLLTFFLYYLWGVE